MTARSIFSIGTFLLVVLASIVHEYPAVAEEIPAVESVTVLPVANVPWEQLNPARGDKSPQAGTLWGDRKADVATGFLVKFVDGFSSPPHIHNVTYRGVVIRGLIHNDDPTAAKMWMPTGSYWTQPKGEVHITAAQGDYNMAYIEINSGPYLVLHAEDAFDSGERPVNVDPSNLVWLDATNSSWIASSEANSPEISYLWGAPENDELNGTLLKFTAGSSSYMVSTKKIRGVVIQGDVNYEVQDQVEAVSLEPGSYFSSENPTIHQVTCDSSKECLVYVRSIGKYNVVPSP